VNSGRASSSPVTLRASAFRFEIWFSGAQPVEQCVRLPLPPLKPRVVLSAPVFGFHSSQFAMIESDL
jgi:hypothetical protein